MILPKMAKGMTRDNLHKEIDFGTAVGKEVW